MKIKRMPVVLHNVLTMEVECEIENWLPYAQQFRNSILINELYMTGPLGYIVKDVDEEQDTATLIFVQPINEPLEITHPGSFEFYEQYVIEDALMIRHADMDVDLDESYEILHQVAEQIGVIIDPAYFHVHLNVYGESMIDIYASIIEEKSND